jgi:hypothetical protein
MPSTDRKLELKAKTSVAQTDSQPCVYAKGLNYCVHRYVNNLDFFLFSLHNVHRRFFPLTERFCIDNARIIDGKIG